MVRVVVDPQLRQKLLDFREPVELIDEWGETVAVVRPALSEVERCAPPEPNPDELRAMLAGPRFTTEELLQRLRRR